MVTMRVGLYEVGFCIFMVSCAHPGAGGSQGRVAEVASRSSVREDPSIRGDWSFQWMLPEGPRPDTSDDKPAFDIDWAPPITVSLRPRVLDVLPKDSLQIPLSAKQAFVLFARVDWYGTGGAVVLRVPTGDSVISKSAPLFGDRGSAFLKVKLNADITHLTVVNPSEVRIRVRVIGATQAPLGGKPQ